MAFGPTDGAADILVVVVDDEVDVAAADSKEEEAVAIDENLMNHDVFLGFKSHDLLGCGAFVFLPMMAFSNYSVVAR